MGLVLGLIAFGLVAASLSAKGSETKPVAISDWNKYDSLFKKYAVSYPWQWLKAIALNESDLGRNALVKAGKVSSDGKSWGLMQLTMPTARDFDKNATIDKLNNAEYSIDLASQYIYFLYRKYGGDERKIIMSYNQGQGNTDRGKEYAAGYYEKFKKNLERTKGDK